MNTAINLKGDKTDITASLALKADSLTVSNNYNSLNAATNIKANITDFANDYNALTTSINLKAKSNCFNTWLQYINYIN